MCQTIATRCQEFRAELGPEITISIIDAFLADTSRRLDALRQTLIRNDIAAIMREAHGLKGSCYNVGAQQLGDTCTELERLAPQGKWSLCQALYTELRDSFAQAKSCLEVEKKRI
jgi:HPt (histidine-containing phosphotransfer) domain-containing protein